MQIDKDIYDATRYKLQKMIINKKRAFLENKLTESIGKPKDLWKALRSLGLPSKTSCEVNGFRFQKLLLNSGGEPCKNATQTN